MIAPLILEISTIVLAAAVGGIVAHKFKLPLTVGYLVVGLILGTVFKSKIQNGDFLNFFSQIGIALLLFTLGLEFSLERLKEVGKPAVLGALIQIIGTAIFGFLLFPALLNVSYQVGLLLGFIVSLSSTTVIVKILYERAEIDTVYGELQTGWLVVQDLVAVPLMIFLPFFSNQYNMQGFGSIALSLFLSLVKTFGFLYLTFVFGKNLIPKVFKALSLYNSRELLLLFSFAFAIAFAGVSSYFGVPFSIGAFLAGVILSTAAVNHEIFTEIRPIRDLFASIFYVSVGFLISLGFILNNLVPIILVSLFVIIVKFVLVFSLATYFKYHARTAFYTASGLFGVGEFAFVIGSSALALKIFNERIFGIITACSVATLILTPFAIKEAHKIYNYLLTLVKKKNLALYEKLFKDKDNYKSFPAFDGKNLVNHIIVIGFGRVGRDIARVFELSNTPYVVIDYSYKPLRSLKRSGKPFVFGDATSEETLSLAQIKSAKAVVLAVPDPLDGEIILNHCLRLNPEAKFIARAHKDMDAAKFKIRGVSHVVQPEFEASLSLARHALYSLDLAIHDIESYLARARKEYRF